MPNAKGYVAFGRVHEGITRELLGKSVSAVLPETLILREKELVDINFELYTPDKKTPYSSAAWYPAEHEFFHPWSISQVSEHYGFHKLTTVLPPETYLTLPNCIVEEFLEGASAGLNKREQRDAEARAKAERGNKHKLTPQQEAELRNAGIDPTKVKV